jgi:hypothetical protein
LPFSRSRISGNTETVFRIAKNHFDGTGTLPVGIQGRSALIAGGEIPES